jgi:hypothetical protein
VLATVFGAVTLVHLPSAFAEQDLDDDDHDAVLFSFSTVGDSRQDPTSPDPSTLPLSGQDKIWLQNTKAWSRIIESIEKHRSNLLFFNGDMIMGYGRATIPLNSSSVSGIVGSDLMQFYRQYGFWRGMVAGLMERGTYVVPVPGNHETQCNSKVSTQCSKSGKNAESENEDAWRANMGDLILDNARFQRLFGETPTNENTSNNGPADSLTTDQSQLSYSFDFRGNHFVVINTDPVGNDAHAPVKWLANDLAAAQGRSVQNIFIFGHKPAFTYYYGKNTPLPTAPSGFDTNPANRDEFWKLVEQYGATYFCGHEHIFHAVQPTVAQGGKAWQVLVGSGGSPFDAAPTDVTLSPKTDRDYAWATVKVYHNGKVRLTAYGFDDQFGQTRVLASVILKQHSH